MSDKRKASSILRQLKIAGNSYGLKFNYTALAALEDLYDLSIEEIGKKLSDGKPRLRDVQRVIYAGLRSEHPEIDYERVGELLDAAIEGGDSLDTVLRQAFEALNASQPAAREGGETDPPTAG